jgi:glycosyltransferase involved in cell wall biosynthesis
LSSVPKHLLHVFPTFEVGGAQMRFSRLVRAHGGRYRNTVIALDHVTDMAARLAPDLPVAYRAIQFDKGKPWSNLVLFRRTIGEIDPDVLVTYNWGAIEWALANRGLSARKHVHIEDGFGPEEADGQLRRRVWGRRLALGGRQTKVVLPSRGLERIALHIWKLRGSQVRFVPNGIDCDRFAVEMSDRQSRPAPLIVGTVATLRQEKNIPRMLNAFCAVAANSPRDSMQLLIVGDGPERETLQKLAAETAFADQIVFTGASAVPQDWYRRMDVFALSSDTEQMPFSVLEAMCSGLPVVSTAVGDVRELVSAENAPQIANDEAGYRAALARLLANSELRLQLGTANQRKAREQFDERLMIERYADIFG